MDIETVFVIGAGASREANLPTGYELKGKISRLLNIRFDTFEQISGDYLIAEALRALTRTADGRGGDINPYLHEAWHICQALPQAISIDNFIDSQRGNEKIAICGKLGIVRSILEAEKNSTLYFDKFANNLGINFSQLEETWYLPFFQLLTENCAPRHLKDRLDSISLIVFNYDRCIEHFLYHAIQNYYRIPEREAAELVSGIDIFHPYGSVGSLPWSSGAEVMDFGAMPNASQLLNLVNQIKTFAEGTDPESSDILAIKERMLNTDRLVFIGFAFHKLNMELISQTNRGFPIEIDMEIDTRPKCYASTFGISENDKEIIKDQINQLYDTDIDTRMANLECHKFFSEFWRSLSF